MSPFIIFSLFSVPLSFSLYLSTSRSSFSSPSTFKLSPFHLFLHIFSPTLPFISSYLHSNTFLPLHFFFPSFIFIFSPLSPLLSCYSYIPLLTFFFNCFSPIFFSTSLSPSISLFFIFPSAPLSSLPLSLKPQFPLIDSSSIYPPFLSPYSRFPPPFILQYSYLPFLSFSSTLHSFFSSVRPLSSFPFHSPILFLFVPPPTAFLLLFPLPPPFPSCLSSYVTSLSIHPPLPFLLPSFLLFLHSFPLLHLPLTQSTFSLL